MGSYEKYKEEKGDVFMSKKMRFWMMGVMGVMMAGLVCVNVYALDDQDVVGTVREQSYHRRPECISSRCDHDGDVNGVQRKAGKGEVTTSSEESEPDVDEFEWRSTEITLSLLQMMKSWKVFIQMEIYPLIWTG